MEVEPQLTKIDNEVFRLQTTSTEDDARLDIKASDFWETGQTMFFDVRVTHVNALSHGTKATTEIFKSQENEKKEGIWKELSRWRTVPSRRWSSALTGEWKKNAAFFSNN